MDSQLDVNTTYRFQNVLFSVCFGLQLEKKKKDVKILRSEQ